MNHDQPGDASATPAIDTVTPPVTNAIDAPPPDDIASTSKSVDVVAEPAPPVVSEATPPVATEAAPLGAAESSSPVVAEPTTSLAAEATPSVAGGATPAPGAARGPRTVGFDPAVAERRKRAEDHWLRIVAAVGNGEILEGTVTSVVSGGLLVDIGGVAGFLPASQARAPEGVGLDALVKTTLPLKIQEVNEKRRRAVVSHRRAVDESRRKRRGELLRSLQIGQRHDARVVRLAPFGAFVDIGSGIEGLVPMSELAFERIEKVDDLLKLGDTFPVSVLRIDEGGRKIAFSRKNALPDPWRDHAETVRVGAVINGTVVGKEPRLQVEIAPGVVGTVRESDADPAQYELGEKVEVSIRNLDRRNRRITLTTMHAAAAAGTFSSGGFAALGEELRKKLGEN